MLDTEVEDWLPNELKLAPEFKANPALVDDNPELTAEDPELNTVDEPEFKVDPELMLDAEFELADCELVLYPKIPTVPEFDVAPKIFVAPKVVVWETQTPLVKLNPFPHL